MAKKPIILEINNFHISQSIFNSGYNLQQN